MKKILFYLLVCLAFSAGCSDSYTANDHISIDNWKFKIGDSTWFAHPDCNDNDWSSIKVSEYWEDQNRKYRGYDGYAWYRTKIHLPLSLKSQSQFPDSLKIVLGNIDDCDQVFLNGLLIGENNKIMQQVTTVIKSLDNEPGTAGVERKYIIAANDPRVYWGKENTIAVRVFDQGGFGGIRTTANPYIARLGLEDYIVYNKDSFYIMKGNNIGDTVLTVINKAPRPVDGRLTISAHNLTKDSLFYSTSVLLKLNPKETKIVPLSIPICIDSTLINFCFSDDISREKGCDQTVLPYILTR